MPKSIRSVFNIFKPCESKSMHALVGFYAAVTGLSIFSLVKTPQCNNMVGIYPRREHTEEVLGTKPRSP